jgi:hypothetical protein
MRPFGQVTVWDSKRLFAAARYFAKPMSAFWNINLVVTATINDRYLSDSSPSRLEKRTFATESEERNECCALRFSDPRRITRSSLSDRCPS